MVILIHRTLVTLPQHPSLPSHPLHCRSYETVLGGVCAVTMSDQSCFLFFLPGDMTHELVRHFLIETGPRGVKLKGCPNEPNFGEHLGLSF